MSTPTFRTVDDAGQPVLDLSRAINPTPETLARRRNPLIQLVRFATFMLRMVVMVAKGHH